MQENVFELLYLENKRLSESVNKQQIVTESVASNVADKFKAYLSRSYFKHLSEENLNKLIDKATELINKIYPYFNVLRTTIFKDGEGEYDLVSVIDTSLDDTDKIDKFVSETNPTGVNDRTWNGHNIKTYTFTYDDFHVEFDEPLVLSYKNRYATSASVSAQVTFSDEGPNGDNPSEILVGVGIDAVYDFRDKDLPGGPHHQGMY